MKVSTLGKNLLKEIELPKSYTWLKSDEDIYPYYVGDRGIIIGYGHYIGYNELSDKSEIALLKEFGLADAALDISHAKLPYIVPGSKAISITRINEILNDDVKIHEDALNKYFSEYSISVSQQEFEALVIYRFLNNQLGGTIVSLLESNNQNNDDWYSAIVGGTKGGSQYSDGWRAREDSVYNLFIEGVYSYQGVTIE
ncbi:hypothetical protein [Lacrimispora sp.]|uniref:hypothetical protein n=1 Tax=Lacrimispora sp. TaxID=2719234 RepID=UPI0028B0FC87|nr:hypothetical protein [Lacrimispora sp.]